LASRWSSGGVVGKWGGEASASHRRAGLAAELVDGHALLADGLYCVCVVVPSDSGL